MTHAHKLKIDGFSKIIKQKIVTPESSFVYFLLYRNLLRTGNPRLSW